MGRADEFKNQATNALATGQMTIEQLWMGVLTGSHQLFEDDDHIIVATKGATAHATEGEILEIAAGSKTATTATSPTNTTAASTSGTPSTNSAQSWASTRPQMAPKSTSSNTTGCRRPPQCSQKSASNIQNGKGARP